MSFHSETKDILREMREYVDEQERMSFFDLRNLATETLRVFIDRIEAAHKRETVTNRNALNTKSPENVNSEKVIYNGAKMWEAMREIARITNTAKSDFDLFVGFERILKISNSALASQPRNCDVATEAEAIESLQQTIPLDGLSENDRNIITACIKDIVGALYAPYTEGDNNAGK